MNNDEFKSWIDNTLVPNLLEGMDNETLISSYLPILLENSSVESRRRVLTNRQRHPSKRKATVKREDLLNLLSEFPINDPLMKVFLETLDINQINKIKFARKIYNGYDIMETGAKVGSIEMIEYAHNHGIEWDESTCKHASKNGHLEILKYLHKNGCPWDKSSCEAASKNGHLDVLKYLH